MRVDRRGNSGPAGAGNAHGLAVRPKWRAPVGSIRWQAFGLTGAGIGDGQRMGGDAG
jgi:hypothetical protein